MIRRLIAAFVLATLCWLSAPVAYASPQPSLIRSVGEIASGYDHSCCPKSHPQRVPALFLAIPASAMPRGAEHPCCAKRAPVSPPAMPNVEKATKLAAEQILAVVADDELRITILIDELPTMDFLPPPFARSTVLRI